MALLIEMAGLFAFLRGTGRAARPLVGTGPTEHGRTFWSFVAGTGLTLPWILQTLSLLTGRSSKEQESQGDGDFHISAGWGLLFATHNDRSWSYFKR